ncbi:MAG: hypothetical protein ABIB98_02825 [bacterium]
MSIQDKKISFSVKQLALYGGIPLVLLFVGYLFFSNFQIGVFKKGSVSTNQGSDQGSGINVVAENSPKRIEYQGEKYMLDGDYCRKSTGQRITITVKRLYGADPGQGSEGNTMYAIDKKDSPEYIDSEEDPNIANEKRNCWMKESSYQP